MNKSTKTLTFTVFPIAGHGHLHRPSSSDEAKYSDNITPRPSLWMGQVDDDQNHIPVRNELNKPRLCLLCQAGKVKTRSGWKVYSRFHCNTCQVPLCTGQRDCFGIYHQELLKLKGNSQDIKYPAIPRDFMTMT